jgi:hypothetical protein
MQQSSPHNRRLEMNPELRRFAIFKENGNLYCVLHADNIKQCARRLVNLDQYFNSSVLRYGIVEIDFAQEIVISVWQMEGADPEKFPKNFPKKRTYFTEATS